MITERLTFRAKYGHGDDLVALFKEWYAKMSGQAGMSSARLYTDATGPDEAEKAELGAVVAAFSCRPGCREAVPGGLPGGGVGVGEGRVYVFIAMGYTLGSEGKVKFGGLSNAAG